MAELNKDEYGQVIRVNMGQDVSAATSYKFILEPKYGVKLEKVDGVSRGTVNITDGENTYIADEYLEYTIEEGDLSYAGQWRKKGEATMSSTNKISTDYEFFTVLE